MTIHSLVKTQRVHTPGPVFVDLLDNSRLVEPTGNVQRDGVNKGKIKCRIYFDETPAPKRQKVRIDHETGETIISKPLSQPKARPPVFSGFAFIPAKMFDDGTAELRDLTRSQHVGFLLKEVQKAPASA